MLAKVERVRVFDDDKKVSVLFDFVKNKATLKVFDNTLTPEEIDVIVHSLHESVGLKRVEKEQK